MESGLENVIWPKSLNSSDPKSYRPISNLSVLCKLLERLISKQLVTHQRKMICFQISSQLIGLITRRRLLFSRSCQISYYHWTRTSWHYCHFWTCQLPLTASTTTRCCKDCGRLTVWAGMLSPGSPLILLDVHSTSGLRRPGWFR